MFIPLGDDVNKRSFPAVGSFLVAVNILVFIYTTRLWYDSRPKGKACLDFIESWGLVPAKVPQGQIFNLFSYMWLHGDIFHLVGNMIVLWAFVGTLEAALGWKRFLGFYLLWGVLAGVSHAAMNWGSVIPMIGASGAIAGMIGAYFVTFGALAQIRTLVWIITPMRINIPAGVFVAIWIGMQMLGLSQEMESGRTGVAWFAHFGGFAAGACTMRLLKWEINSRLVRGKDGAIQLMDAPLEPDDPSALVEPSSAPSSPPTACPYCGTALEAESKIYEKLLRCPGTDCHRLIYLG